MERGFGHDFSDVRVHTDGADTAQAVGRGAAAFTVGTDVAFAPGLYTPDTARGRALLAHELAHVVQQSADTGGAGRATADGAERQAMAAAQAVGAGAAVPALSPVARGSVQCAPMWDTSWLDGRVLDGVASSVLGPVQWTFLREFLRGAVTELNAQPPERLAGVVQRFSDLQDPFSHWGDKKDYLKGLVIGIGEGLWESLKGLWDAVVFIVTLPVKVVDFLTTTLPNLAAKYGPRLLAALAKGGSPVERISKVIRDVLSHPGESLAQMAMLVDGALEAGAGMARDLGKRAVDGILRFVEEPWREFGEDVGRVVGMILFEVILALATEAIGTVVKKVAEVSVRFAARVATEATALFRRAGEFVRTAIAWVGTLISKLKGEIKGVFQGLHEMLGELGTVLGDLAEGAGELAAEGPGGVLRVESRGVRVTDEAITKARRLPTTVEDLRGGRLESRAVKDTGGGTHTSPTRPRGAGAESHTPPRSGFSSEEIQEHLTTEGPYKPDIRGESPLLGEEELAEGRGVRRPSNIEENREIGDTRRDALAREHPGAKSEVSRKTKYGPRRDDVVTLDGLSIESKVGVTDLTEDIAMQLLKDKDKLDQGGRVLWVFQRSPGTGLVGPTPRLEAALNKLKIPYEIRP